MVEIGKTVKVDLNAVPTRVHVDSPIHVKIMSLNPGEGFEVEGLERGQINSRFGSLRKEGRFFRTQTRGVLKFFVWREK